MAAEERGSLAAREAAVKMLLAVCKDGQFSHEAKEKYLVRIQEKRERALATRLFSGCLERMTELDYIIDRFSKTPVRKMKPVVAAILRTTVYQLRFMDKIPAGAACNEAVKLTKKLGFSGLSGFVNGVARAVARAGIIEYPKAEENRTEFLSVRYSMPTTFVEQITEQYGTETAEKIFAAFLEKETSVSVRCMTHTIAVEQLIEAFQKAGIRTEKGVYSKEALRLFGIDSPEALPLFHEGAFYIQDESSMQAVFAAGLSGGERVLDLCAAPGGKSVLAADILCSSGGGGTVEARDCTTAKTALLEENKTRCGLQNITVRCMDATVYQKEDMEGYDVVLADVPCSGLGILGKKPDIKLFMTREREKELCILQKKILENAVRYVKKGGVLIFSTCTLNKEENMGGFCFLKECGMQPESLEPFLSKKLWTDTAKDGYLQLLPGIHEADGFFLARFRKPSLLPEL